MSKANSWKSYIPKNFETEQKAAQQHQAILKAISGPRPKGLTLYTLKRKLENCNKASPCANEACPKCRRIYRKTLVKEIVKQNPQEGVWTRVSVIPNDLLFPERELHKAKLKTIIRRLNKNIERTNLSDAIIIGGIDVSLNTFSNVVEGWQLHLYFLINRPLIPALRNAIKSAFKCKITKSVPRPYSFKEIKADEQDIFEKHFGEAITYSYKNIFNRRSAYFEKRAKTDSTSRRRVSNQPLQPGQQPALLKWLSKFKTGDRLFLRKIKRLRAAPLCLNLSIDGKLVKRDVSPQKTE